MNNAPLTLILIASLGIVAVISLGVFFAVRPKFADTEQHLAEDFIEEPQTAVTESTSPTLATSSEGQVENGDDKIHDSAPSTSPSPNPELTSAAQQVVARNHVAQPPAASGQSTSDGGKSPRTGRPPSSSQSGEPTFGQSSRTSGDREVVSTVELLDSLRIEPIIDGDQGTSLPPTSSSSPSTTTATKTTNGKITASQTTDEPIAIRELKVENEVDMHRYSKVVGIAYWKDHIYVPSYQNGNISVYETDSLYLVKEYSCDGCHVYDIGVLSNGDMVLSQGKHSKITKLSSKTGKVVKEIAVPYSTKGIAVSNLDEIFVLSRDHDAVYVYDAQLKQLGSLPIVNKEKSDCNFISYAQDTIYVSCESAVHVINVQGKEIQTLKPFRGMYAIGISVTDDPTGAGKVYVGHRGTSVVNVYDKNGKYLESVGEKKDSLWSDIVVGGKYMYVIEYITTTIKQYSLE